ncbi:hypothetical protein AJ79_05627 [Helicocarpus griseus UAMH5409]|uniref:Cell surface spherulin 4-like protein n=1 Tax=Helicocarpus griseus UAMH5409 TaxID=1447875 RepID=A0A2B7XLJ8_9EURO|nr:hypothetical protein AJ79_05627 [Helicocarpus griseus UAMH5409]
MPPILTFIIERQYDNMGPKATIFVPLYIYPEPGAWDPLYEAIEDYPNVDFTVIVNPGSGPGPDPLPDEQYMSEIPNLSGYANVRLLGYVATTYTDRDLDAALRDVNVYANWPSQSEDSALALNGIFFDETPREYAEDAVKYLEELSNYVRNLDGFRQDNVVVHNPGTVPDPRYNILADMTVLFEATYETFQQRKDEVFKNLTNHDRSTVCCVVHSVPEDVTGNSLRELVRDARTLANEVFITHLSERYYESFGSRWREFIQLMAEH